MLEDKLLIWRFKRGHFDALQWIYNKYKGDLLKLAIVLTGDICHSEDVVQDVFVRVWQNRKNLDPSKMIKAYLFTSVKNNSLKHLRHLKIETKGIVGNLSYISDDERPDKKLDENEMELKIHQAVNELPEKCKEIFKMNRFENLKYAEIATILDISIKTVETQMGRALKKLRERLKPYLTMILFVLTSILILTI